MLDYDTYVEDDGNSGRISRLAARWGNYTEQESPYSDASCGQESLALYYGDLSKNPRPLQT